MKGVLSEGTLPDLLRRLYIGRKTGVLRLADADVQRSVQFRRGNIERAISNAKEERLGETLVRLGLLSQDGLARATEVVLRDKLHLGQALQALGVMDKDHLQNGMAAHVREILLHVFASPEGTYEFVEQPESETGEDMTLKVSTGEMILEAVRRIQDPDVVRFSLGDLDRVLGLSTDPLLRFQRIILGPTDGYVLSRVDGALSAREVIQVIPLQADDVCRSLLGLLSTGVIEYLPLPRKPAPQPGARSAGAAPPGPLSASGPSAAAPPPEVTPAARPAAAAAASHSTPAEAEAHRREILEIFEGLKGLNHFDVLGIPRASSEADVKAAYFKLARRFHPDTHHDTALADLRDKIEAIFIRVGEAYEVLRNPRMRGAYEADLAAREPRVPQAGRAPAPEAPAPPPPPPPPQPVNAEALIRQAERFVSNQKWWDAIQALEAALPHAEGKPRNRARLLLAKALLKNPHWIKRGEEQLNLLIKDDPHNAEAYFMLAEVYKGGGLRTRAVHMLRKALEVKPDHEGAAALLAELGPPPEAEADQEKGGLLKKLFGKN